MITDHKLLVALRNTAKNTPIQHKNTKKIRIQVMATAIHYRLAIKTGTQNKDEEIPGMCITIHAILKH